MLAIYAAFDALDRVIDFFGEASKSPNPVIHIVGVGGLVFLLLLFFHRG